MMAAYAEAAVRIAAAEFGRSLDFDEGSLEAFDEVLTMAAGGDEGGGEFPVRLWGSYFGELLRRRYAGEWRMSDYPGSSAAVPAVEVRGSLLYPLMKVYRRLTLGEGESLADFYAMVAARLGDPARPH
jgi:hypothetical protein